MSVLILLILAIGLSMDAFSIALAYGTLDLPKRLEIITSIIVGLFHFFMPICGFKVGKIILEIVLNKKYKIMTKFLFFSII